jgi:predicted GIY-YIG superfamily endonuclease
MSNYVYLLLSSDNCTYVGATNDLDRRLRQHNKEIAGGAVATTSKVLKGEAWIRVAHVRGFPDRQAALQFEWRWKHLSRQVSMSIYPLKRRMIALKKLLSLDRPTTNAKLYSEWETPVEVVIEDAEARAYYDEVFGAEIKA